MKEQVFEGRILAAGPQTKLAEWALGQQAAGLDYADAIDQPLRYVEDVRGENDGAAGPRAVVQQVLDLARDRRIEAGQRFVEDQQPGIVQERAGERRLLFHAARKTLAALVAVRPQVEALEQLLARSLDALRVHAPEAADAGEAFDRRELVVEQRLVRHPGDHALGRRRVGERVDAEDLDRARVGGEQADDHAQRGGLAGAVGAEQPVELARADRQVEIGDGGPGEGF